MPFLLTGPPEEAAAQLCSHLGLHKEAHRELIKNDDGSYNCRKCRDMKCAYNRLAVALAEVLDAFDQRLSKIETQLATTP